jgi:hypothetical protein
MKTLIAVVIVSCGFLVCSNMVRAQTWTLLANTPVQSWDYIGMSANGNTIVAGIYGSNFHLTSTNSGATWITNKIPSEFGQAACSADGTKWVCTDGDLDTYRSTNSGVSWFFATANRNGSVACSADGNILGGFNALSTNGGATWINVYQPGIPAFPANGNKWLNVNPEEPGGGVFISTNMGATWITNSMPTTNINYRAVGISADGNTIVGGAWYSGAGGANPDALFFTTNSGSSWSKANVPSNVWAGAACSADGSTLVAVASGTTFPGYNPSIYTSKNHGISWVSNSAPNVPWAAVACSADGSKMVAVVGGGQIYISNSKPSPQLNITPASNSNFNFSWLIPSTNMALQESPDLSTWTTLTNVPSLNYTNLQEQITLPPGSGNGFFRLVSQ